MHSTSTKRRSGARSRSKAGSSADPWLGKKIGPALLEERIGAGGMGHVYRARHLSLNKNVAVKVLRSNLPTDVKGVERFILEARATARLEHPGIVTVYDAGKQGHVYYIIMQYVDGESLGARLEREHRLCIAEALRIFRCAAEAVEYAHRQGIIHRDIKPDNILLGKDGSVKIVDFGLARVLEGNPNLSRTGTIVGSPGFMSPEQALGKRLDQRTDVYSLGATFYQMITGESPYRAKGAIEVVWKVVKEPLTPAHEVYSSVPLELSRFIHEMMRKDRGNRIRSVRAGLAFLDEIERTGRMTTQRTGRRCLLIALAALVALALLIVGHLVINFLSGPSGDGLLR